MTTQEILQGVHDWTNGKIVYDISVAHPDGQGNPTKYADLTAALGTGGANIPEALRKGGMSVKFVSSSDNNYHQFHCMTKDFSTIVGNWQEVVDSQLEVKLQGVTAEETKVALVENTNWFDGKRVKNDGTIQDSTAPAGGVASGILIINVNGCKRVRFLGIRVSTITTTGYGFSENPIDPTSTSVQLTATAFWGSAGTSVPFEYIVDVPDGMNYFACTIYKLGTSETAIITINDFYCYTQIGNTVYDTLASISAGTVQKKILPNCISGKFVSGVDGNLTASENTNVYEIKDLTGCETITGPLFKTDENSVGLAFYDASGNFISGLVNNTQDTGTLTTLVLPLNAKSVKWTYYKKQIIFNLSLKTPSLELDNSDRIGLMDYQQGKSFIKSSFENCIHNYGIIAVTNLWQLFDKTQSHIIVDIAFAENSLLTITPRGGSCIFAFLKTYTAPTRTGQSVNYAGEATRYVASEEMTVTIPPYSKYLYLYRSNGYNNALPATIQIKKTNSQKIIWRKLDLSSYYSYEKVINSSNSYVTQGLSSGCLIPVNNFSRIKIKAGINNCVYAKLVSAVSYFGNYGEPNFSDTDDGRHIISAGEEITINVTNNFNVLYFTDTNELGESIRPEIYVEDKAHLNEQGYRLILREDFDNGISDIWKPVQYDAPSGSYISRFYADENNWYADSGCMVLKLENRNGLLTGPYISTAKTLAMKSGKVRLRVKVTNNDPNFKWCFWLFGQNKVWPHAVEIDLFEKTYNTQLTAHIHYCNANDEQLEVRPSFVEESWFGTNWHILELEYNSEKVITYFDGMKLSVTNLTTLNMGDNGLVNPMDFRFNVKAGNGYASGDAMMLIDWIEIYSDEMQGIPLMGFVQEDVTMTVGQTQNISPSFVPSNAINRAFELTSSDDSIVKVHQFDNDRENGYVSRLIEAKSTGTAVLTLKSYKGNITKQFNVVVLAE